jgi:LAO/AO transport system kinase
MNEVLALAGARMRTALAAAAADDPRVQGLLDAVVARRIDPANAARQMLAGDAGRQAAPLLERTLTADLED